MPEVQFHYNVGDRLQYACRLLRKAVATGVPVSVLASPDLLDRLDRQLWTFEDLAFVPHVRAGADGHVAPHLARTPVWLVEQVAHAPASHAVMVLLADDVPDGLDRFDRLVEIVSDDPDEREQGRRRWRSHAQAGRTVVPHDTAGGA